MPVAHTRSLWMDSVPWPEAESVLPHPGEPRSDSGLTLEDAWTFQPHSLIDRRTPADVVVVGAGIAGMTTAYLLLREGRQVMVVDKGEIAGGETSRTTAHLSNAIDDRYTFIEEQHGEEGARLAAESHTAAIDLIERIAAAEGIACDFRRVDGYLFTAPDHGVELLDQELAAAQRAGLADVTRVDDFALPGGGIGPALRFPRQGQFDPMKYIAGLARSIRARGGRLVGGHAVTSVEGGEHATIHTADGRSLRSIACVVATNSPVIDRFAIHTKQAPYRTYVVGLRIPRGILAPALWWDTREDYHYARLQAAEDGGTDDILIVGGEDHKTGEGRDMDQRFLRLEDWARRHFPQAGEVAYRWSGQVMEPFDGLAFIGRDPANTANIMIATGDSGMGMTHGTIAGMLITDLLMGRANAWAGLYDPTRKITRNLQEFMKENLDVAREFAFGHAGGGDAVSEAGIPLGGGAVLRMGGHKVAVHRGEDGHLHRVTATCTHLGCTVHFNPLERSWDCPCHGSRFDTDGRVLSGPAVTPLSPVAEDGRVGETGS
ncbi:MAG: Gamma-glutamylputrescine oxidoreductase [Pseudomonadota bacterium]|jgi:glycine/D-amino acid oxidase-like deaminating enzyme/nitrite reductase/ring-hydroxylating ferredoxin subunit